MNMKLSSAFYTLGFSLIILGLSLGAFSHKEYKETETKPISMERSCAIEAVYAEGRNTSVKERKMILQVILNRVNHKDYPSTICGVVHQPYQFSYYNNLKSNASIIPKFESMNSLDRKAFLEIEELVDTRLGNSTNAPNRAYPSVLFFHTKAVSPRWASTKRKVAIDNRFAHKYYTSID